MGEEICRKLGVSVATFYRWKKSAAGRKRPTGPTCRPSSFQATFCLHVETWVTFRGNFGRLHIADRPVS
ncbi:transposase [Hansschlegelia beijingensis]|uniref:transposase n=1 Tax=Hansschlegelia beijingensis TaxID=1133344 RepID=UPI001610236C